MLTYFAETAVELGRFSVEVEALGDFFKELLPTFAIPKTDEMTGKAEMDVNTDTLLVDVVLLTDDTEPFLI